MKRPRICMPTARGFTKKAFRCGLYEAQDVLLEADNVDLICLEARPGFDLKAAWQKKLIYHDVSRRLMSVNPGLRKVRITQEYDLFIAICQDVWDLTHINAIEGWKDHCKTSVLWIDEIWNAAIPEYKYLLDALKRFDHIFIGCKGSIAPLSQAIGQTCHWLPGGVDTVRFSPYPSAPARVIDVYGIGRRHEGIHRALLSAAERGDIFYVYDTFHAADTPVHDHRQHRDLYANVAKRSRCFLVAPAKADDPATHGQVEVGYRYYEGAAAGAVMIGQAPDCAAFAELFPWPDAVIPVQPDGSDIMEVFSNLASEPERLFTISRRNTAEATLRHDWLYRWQEIFRVAGLDQSRRMATRERRLKQLAGFGAAECDPALIRAVQR